MKKILSVIIILICLQFDIVAQITECDSLQLRIKNEKDSLPKFDFFMKDKVYGLSLNSTFDNNFSFGIGYYFYSDLFSPYKKIPLPSFETNINYHLDGYLHHNLSVQIPFLISPSLNLSTYTNFNKTSIFLRPGIGINTLIISANYNFNWLESDKLRISTKHNFSLAFRFGIVKNVWKETDDIYQSQYDRRKIRKKK